MVRGDPVEKINHPVEPIEERAKSTKELIQTLLQTIKTYRLYDAHHPTLTRLLDRLRGDFDRYFGEFDSFSIQVGEHQLFYQGDAVYESPDVKGSLAFLFFKDGIREIQFFKGLEYKELEDFLIVIRENEMVNHLEDDLVTLLWEKDFAHIDFVIVDDFLKEDDTTIPSTFEDLLKGMEHTGLRGESIRKTSGGAEIEEASMGGTEALKQLLLPSSKPSLVQAYALSHDAIKEIDQEVEEEQQLEYLSILNDELIEILLHLTEDADAHENIIAYYKQIIESLLEKGEIKKVVTILKDFDILLGSLVLKDKQLAPIRAILEIASNPHAVELLGNTIKENGAMDSEGVLQYFQFLTKQAIDPLCRLLKELESGNWRELICDRLTELCKDRIELLSKYLSDPDALFVFYIISILGRVGHPSTLEYLRKMVIHHDPKIRGEILQLISQFGGKGTALVQRLLKDPLPEIRGKAALVLADMDKAQAVKLLSDMILSKDFYKRDYEEKVSFFKALGKTGSKEVITILSTIAKKGSWFKGAKWNEMRLCAANTLKIMEAGHQGNLSKKKDE
jgi:hypothetical protein